MSIVSEVMPHFDVFTPKDGVRICLWCKKPITSINSNSEYHIIPRQFTETEGYKYTMPKGVVCDKCNNSFGNNSEPALIELMKERLAFLKKRKHKEQFVVDDLRWDVHKGKLSIHMDRLLESPQSRIPHPKYCFGSAFLNKKARKSKSRNKGLIHTAIQKIAFETLYCDFALSSGDEVAYTKFFNPNHNFYKLTNLVKDFISKKTDNLFNNVKVISSRYGFQGNINTIRLKTHRNIKRETGECVFIFLCGIQFFVSFLPNGNTSLTDEEVSSLVKGNYEDLIRRARLNKN